MYILKKTKKILSFITCAAISFGILTVFPWATDNAAETFAARTIEEIQEQRKANAEKIAELENQIQGLEGDKSAEEAAKAALEEQVTLIQENINLLNTELEALSADITATETNIVALDADIVAQQNEIDVNVEKFKERLCSMYMTGGDTSASVILGSTSFYDMMSRIQMINSIAEHDDQLINEILADIDALEQSKSDLETEKLNLTMKLDEQQARKEEKEAEIDNLSVKMADTQYEIDRLANEQAALAQDKADLEAMDAELAAEEAAIEAEIQRQAEEAQRRWEEQERQRQQALLQQQLQQQQQQQQANTGDGTAAAPSAPADPIYTVPSPAASGFIWPCPGFSYISSYYGWRWGRSHNGIDVGDGNIMGGSAVAAQSGTVIIVNNSCTHNYAKPSTCGCGGGFGNYVVISHDGTYSTVYGHLSYASVSVGDYVQQGDVIGAIGSTGWSTGAHLHFEVKVNGVAQDPMGYVSP